AAKGLVRLLRIYASCIIVCYKEKICPRVLGAFATSSLCGIFSCL
ncbi:hypothetical protein M513_04008, partial [Trichuris suis]